MSCTTLQDVPNKAAATNAAKQNNHLRLRPSTNSE
jgi:hypothetical protein